MKERYVHNAKYYETDQMGIVHHSNYIRWMEEARIDLMDRLGCGYAEMERRGITSPVVEVCCKFVSMTRFGDNVEIAVRFAAYNGVKLRLSYEMRDGATDALRAEGESTHCFMADGKPVAVKKAAPDFHERFLRAMIAQ